MGAGDPTADVDGRSETCLVPIDSQHNRKLHRGRPFFRQTGNGALQNLGGKLHGLIL